jgi:SAM-dependent methyltransferase
MWADDNQRLYERRFVGAHYARKSELKPDEAAILRRYRAEIVEGRILDIGVGGGRTTPHLLELSSDYIGVDYSHEMVERCRRRYPGVDFELCDARDLSAFPDASFDFVLFTYNGIDAVGHDDRLKVLSGIRRVLRQDGLFFFSSHNRNFRIPKPWELQHFGEKPFSDPLRLGKRSLSYPVGIMNYLRNAYRGEIEDEYCIVVDAGDKYALMHYRIGAAAQRDQLIRAGFRRIEMVAMDGRWLSLGEADASEDAWINYICRRGG